MQLLFQLRISSLGRNPALTTPKQPRQKHSKRLWCRTSLSLGPISLASSSFDAACLSFMNPGARLFSERAHVCSSYRFTRLFLCREKQQELSPRLFGWLTSIVNADYTKIKDINGLDCYFFVRFLRMMVRMMLPIWILSWAVLFPLTFIDSEVDSHAGLEKFTIGNVAAGRQSRYVGHLALTWIFTSKIPCWYPCGNS